MIIFLYGEDDFRAKQKLKELKDKFEREVDKTGGSFIWVDGEKTNLKEINEKASATSLLARKQMVVIENIFKTKTKELLEEVKNYFKDKEKGGNDNVIIFLDNNLRSKKKYDKTEIVKIASDGRDYPLGKNDKILFDFLVKQKFSQEFKKLTNLEMIAWIKKEAEERGGEFNNQSASLLIGLTGGDLWQIDQEINKLINYKAGKMPSLTNAKVLVEEDEVEELVKGAFEENIFALTDAIGNRNKSQALKLLEQEIKAGANENYLLTMIIRQVKIILQARAGLDSGASPKKIASDLKMNSFVIQKATSQARNFTIEVLKRYLAELIEIDYKSKTGQGEILSLLGVLISKI